MHWSSYLNDPALADFVAQESHGIRVLIRRGYRRWTGRLGLDGTPAEATEMVRGGRQPHPLVEIPGCGRVMVRQYLRGGAIRHLNRSRYFGGHRAFEELRITERARAAGVQAPMVIAAAERPHLAGYTAWLATGWIPEARDLHAWLLDHRSETALQALRQAGRQIQSMHAASIGHPDLNLRNLLVTDAPDADSPAIHILDFDRAKLFGGPVPAWRRERDLRRLMRSASKLGSPIPAEGWEAFREGYGAAWPLRSLLG